ncbi:Chaperone protein DnaJ [Penicillium rolfsii]|nr:Chaperone protein DnaJ [Penicillium rolfsii]
MVKADVRRDYYADLGLQPSAEAEDIKKQFRRLALKYHPDRNQGREQEVIAKFQAIQAAHEILSDSQQRLKYDTERLRAGYGKVYGPSKTAPRKTQPSYSQNYSTATPPKTQGSHHSVSKDTPPSPIPLNESASSTLNVKIPNKPQAPKPFSNNRSQGSQGTSNGPSAGASRYATHARAGPQQRQQDEAQTRADAFKGFHNMRSQNWRGFDPTSGATPRQQNTPFGNPKPKSAYEYFKENAQAKNSASTNTDSAKKRHGYAPGTAAGDEPMAPNTSAYTSTRSERPSSMYFDSAPPPTAKKPTRPVSPNWQSESAEPPSPPLAQEFERTSRSYATTGGEKTFFTNPGLGRSSTMRTPTSSYRASNTRTNPPSPDPAQPERHRSASPKIRRDRSYSISSITSSDLDDESEDEVRQPSAFKPMAVPKSRLRPNQKFADFYRTRDSSPGTGEEASARPDTQGHRRASATHGTRKPQAAPTYIDLTADSDDNKGHNSDSAAFVNGSYRPGQQDSNSRFLRSTNFTRDKTTSAASARRDASNLHKKFSAEDWRVHLDEFDFLGASTKERDPLGKAGSANLNARPRASTRVSPTQPSASAGFSNLNAFNSSSRAASFEPQPQQGPTPFAQAKFSADKWSKDLHNISWTAAEKLGQSDTASSSRSPKKSSRPGTKVRSTPKAAKVASEAEEAVETVGADTVPEHSSSIPVGEEPMDIDEELPSVPIGSARNTKYPDLSTHSAQGAHTGGSQRPQPPLQKERISSQNGVRSPLFDLGQFGNTAPFTSTNSGGIENLGDVSATLPFESRPKVHTTTKDDIRPRDLQLPNPPKRPTAPAPIPIAPGSHRTVLSREKWNWYVSAMGTYMHEWNTFNRRMLLHFNTRQDAIETGLAPGWISAVGDTTRLKIDGVDDEGGGGQNGARHDRELTEVDEYLVPGSGKGGFSAYLRGIEEDAMVRKHWDVACELHRDCILELGRLREWIRNGGKVA